MRFVVTRTRYLDEDEPPVPGAVKGEIEAWFIELADLDALVAFWKEHGDLVLREAFGNNELPCIEVYDDYRE